MVKESPVVVDITPLVKHLEERRHALHVRIDEMDLLNQSAVGLTMACDEINRTLDFIKGMKPPSAQYDTWRRKVPGAHQVFCPRCDGKESCPRPFCPRCGLNMRPPEGVKPDYV